jgi:hypothetical protein
MPPSFTMSGPFNIKEARYFCGKPATAVNIESFRTYLDKQVVRGRELREGSTEFEVYRMQSLREADRNLFLALSNYRRSQDLLTSSSAHWSWVTMYYSAFFSANSILGLIGVSVNPKRTIVDVLSGKPESQRLAVGECPEEGPTQEWGDHRLFWDFFYSYVASLRSYLPADLKRAVDPVGKSRSWQISHRNRQNYDSFAAIETCAAFKTGFRETNFPSSLDEDFRTQHEGTKSLLDVTLWLVHEINFSSDALDSLCGRATLRNRTESAIGRADIPFTPGRSMLNKTSVTRPWLSLRV